ncbi:MAG: arsenate reductase (glutaredoxin) [Gammaproteobacteria bacterium]|nr:arsenate reductase (glutaredoxin) [Gammaproteobacteria bacterium]
MKIYHNPHCSKSRQTLQLIEARQPSATVIEYLKSPPAVDELNEILNMLHLEPRQLLRTQEAEYTQLGLADISLSREQLLEAMVAHPILIERPIVVHNGKAIIGRPPETVLEII